MKVAYRGLQIKWALLRPVTVGVRMMLIRDGKILMIRQTYLPGWHFPGGMVDRYELLQQAAEREAHEEVGVICNGNAKLFGLYSNFIEYKSDHIVVFYCHDFEIASAPDRWEIAEIGWFPLDKLPQDASAGSKRRATEYLAGKFGIAGQW